MLITSSLFVKCPLTAPKSSTTTSFKKIWNGCCHIDGLCNKLSAYSNFSKLTNPACPYANVSITQVNKAFQIGLYNKINMGIKTLIPFKYSSFFQHISKVDVGINKIWIQSNCLLSENKEYFKTPLFKSWMHPFINWKRFLHQGN